MSAHDPADPWSVAAAAARAAAAAAGLIPREWFDLARDDQDVVRERAYALQRTAVPAAFSWQMAMEEHRKRAELRAAIGAELRAALRRPVSRILRRGVRR